MPGQQRHDEAGARSSVSSLTDETSGLLTDLCQKWREMVAKEDTWYTRCQPLASICIHTYPCLPSPHKHVHVHAHICNCLIEKNQCSWWKKSKFDFHPQEMEDREKGGRNGCFPIPQEFKPSNLQGALLWCPLGQGGREHVLIRKAKPSISSSSFHHPCHLQTRAEGSALCSPGR